MSYITPYRGVIQQNCGITPYIFHIFIIQSPPERGKKMVETPKPTYPASPKAKKLLGHTCQNHHDPYPHPELVEGHVIQRGGLAVKSPLDN